MEIERKFLVKRLPDLSNCLFYELSQGYLNFTPEVRIRKKLDEFILTCKSDGDQDREEVENFISEKAFNNLLLDVKGRMIDKVRYEIPLNDGLIAELDIYHGDLEGLFTVEVEFKSDEKAEVFEIPEWFGEEITFDKRYKNKNLARNLNVKELIPSGNDLILKKE